MTPGAGAIVGTRDAGGGVEIQRVIPNTFLAGTATDVSSAAPLPVSSVIKDGVTSNLATVAVFHNTDNQAPGGLGFGLLTGGVAQLVNVAGNLDRQRETGADNISAVGIASGTQQLASPIATTIAASVATGTQTVTPAVMSGTSRGAVWSIQQGSVLAIANSNGSNAESVVVTSVTGTTFTATFASTKTGPAITVKGYTYNQARDATTADGSTGQGFAAGATYLFNAALNSAAGGWESERSAAGEQDGASGAGTAVAAEYENNSGGPPLPSGLASALQYDRGRNVAGKGYLTAAITAAGVGASTLTATTAASVNLLQPGAPVYLLSGSTVVEVCYVTQAYVPGTASIPLQNNTVTGGETTIAFDIYAPNGPGINGFSPTGIEIAEEALWDPVTQLFYIERSATQDTISSRNVVMENPGLFNGSGTATTSMDRGRSASAANVTATNGIGVELTAPPGNWTVVSTPAISVQASASKAAGGAGVYFVVTGIYASLVSGTAAPTAVAPILLNLRNGATGAGSIIWSTYVTFGTATSTNLWSVALSGLAIPGLTNAAVTLEFSVAGTLIYQSCSLTGYTTQ